MDFGNETPTEALDRLASEGKFVEALPLLEQIDVQACEHELTIRNFLRVASHAGSASILTALISQISPKFKNKLLIVLDYALSYVRVGEEDRGVHYFLEAQEIGPTNYWSYYWYAQFLAERKKYQEALGVISVGLERCRGRVIETEWENLQRDYFRYLCLARRDDVKYAKQLGDRAFYTGRAVPNALFVTMAKDEDDIIYGSLEAAYKLGFRYYLIANNGSTDETAAEIRRFSANYPSATVIGVWDPIAGYWQDKKMNAFWRFGVEYLAILGVTIDWIFPVDADEALVQADEAIDLCHVLNSPATACRKIAVGMWCTATPAELTEKIDPALDINAAFPIVSGYDMAPFTKVSIRVSPTVSLAMGNHFAFGCVETPSDVMCLNEFGIFMIHHPYRSRKQYRSKITNGMKALQAATTLGAQHGGHWRKAYEIYAVRGEAYVDEQLNAHFDGNRSHAGLLERLAIDCAQHISG